MDIRLRLQLAEALGSFNRWFCSKKHGREITNDDLLMEYYIRSGGAADFARRYNQAMGAHNRWYCSEFYRRDIRDCAMLWEYYVKFAPAGAVGKDPRNEPGGRHDDMNIAC